MALTNWETGTFKDRSQAEDAVDRLHGWGYGKDDISVMMHDKTAQREFAEKTGTKSTEGALAGGAIGGALGAIVAGLTATGSIAAIAGTGGAATPLVAGPLAAALAGLGGGGIVGGLVGALVGAGIPEHQAKQYENDLNDGGILLGVTPRDDHRDQVRDLFTSGAGATGMSGGRIDRGSFASDDEVTFADTPGTPARSIDSNR